MKDLILMKNFLLIVLLFFCFTTHAQISGNKSALYRIETIDGNEYVGNIVLDSADIFILKTTSLGEIRIRKADVKRITEVSKSQVKDGELWFDNPQATRYFWQANGYGLKKGEGYYQNVWIFFNQVSYGITDNISIGAGIVPLFLFAGASTPVWLTPKLSIPIVKDKFNVGAGALVGTVLGEEDAGFGIAYGTTTFGNRNTNVSLGLGYGYLSGEWADVPTVSLSAMIRTGQRGYLITENYFIGTADEDAILLSFGGRRLIKNSGLDFGLLFPVNTDGSFFAIPWLGITIPFGSSYVPKPSK
jgi:hypothetical protein